MKKTIVRVFVSNFFGNLGVMIARRPFLFIIPPVVLTAVFSFGLINMKYNEDLDYLLTSDKGRVFNDKQFIQRYFPFNSSTFFNFLRIVERPTAAVAFILNKNESEVLRKDFLLKVNVLDQIVRNITVHWHGRAITYSDVCGIVHQRCFENPVISLSSLMEQVVSRKVKLTFPLEIDPFTLTARVLFLNFGGVRTDEEGYMTEARAMRLLYPVDDSNVNKTKIIKEWKRAFVREMKTVKFDDVKICSEPFVVSEFDLQSMIDDITPFLSASTLIVCCFCMFSYMTNNWVRSKPWMGVAAVVCAGMAIIASFGIMGLCGRENVKFNIVLPFLILATEIDDAFVVISSWRCTSSRDSVESRLQKTLADCAVSITITSLTNIFSYSVGTWAQFPMVRLFCTYAAICVFFNYLFQVTFFAGCLALSGYREERGFHPVTFRVSTGFIRNEQRQDEEDYRVMKTFKYKFSRFIFYSKTQCAVVMMYLLNLGLGIWGFTSLNEGLNVYTLYPSESETTESFRIFYRYFTEYSFPVHVVINKTLDYSNPRVQKSIDDLMNKFHSHPNIVDPNFDVSWLKFYRIFQNHPVSKYSLAGYDFTQKQDFIDGLRHVFLRFQEANQFSNDINFNRNKTEIVRSRFFLLAKNVSDRLTEAKVINDLWKIAEESPLPVIAHTFVSPMVEQGIVIRYISFQVFWITAVLIFIAFFLFVPDLLCTVIVALSVATTTVTTMGYMSLWGINLDVISMISFILCIGFCVNYPAHICYSFLISSNPAAEEKLRECLYHVGFPIVQGTVSNILGVLIFLYHDMYAFTTFVKIVLIISIQTGFHALFVVPTLLTFVALYRERK